MPIRSLLRVLWFLPLALVAVLLLVACGATAPVADSESQAAQPSSAEGVSVSSDPSGSDSLGAIGSFNPCDAISMVGGGMPGGFAMQALGGPSIETSESPTSYFAENVSDFVRESMDEVLGDSVSADCFMEVAVNQGGQEAGVWVALSLPEGLAPGQSQAISEQMEERGAKIAGAFSSAAAGGTFDLISFEELPFDAPGGGAIQGGLFFVTTEEDNDLAILVATYSSVASVGAAVPGSESISESGGEPQVESAPNSMNPLPVPEAVTPTGVAAEVNRELEPALESALGVELVLESFFQTAAAGTNTVTLAYVIDGGMPSGSDPLPGLTQVVESLGGNVSFNFSSGEMTNVTYEGVTLGGGTATGSLTLDGSRISVILSSTN